MDRRRDEFVVAPRWVPRHDRRTRRAAAHTVRKAYRTHLLTLVSGSALLLFIAGIVGESLADLQPAPGSSLLGYYGILGAVVVVAGAFGFSVMPWMMYASIRWSGRVAYVDTGRARAAAAVSAAGSGQQKIHSLGAWPRERGAGRALGEWMLAEIHADGCRVLVYAAPGLTKTYQRYGLFPETRPGCRLQAIRPRALVSSPGGREAERSEEFRKKI